MDPAPTRAASGEPSHPHANLTPTRDKNPDDQSDDHARERSGLEGDVARAAGAHETMLVHRTGVRVEAMAGTGAADAVGDINPRLVGSPAWTLPLRRSRNSTISESLGTVD